MRPQRTVKAIRLRRQLQPGELLTFEWADTSEVVRGSVEIRTLYRRYTRVRVDGEIVELLDDEPVTEETTPMPKSQTRDKRQQGVA